jgi:hypothetical protein
MIVLDKDDLGIVTAIDTMWYLASPYTHEISLLQSARYLDACKLLGQFKQMGVNVYSPIAMCHTPADMCNLPTTDEYWANMIMLDRCDGLIVASCMTGWKQSRGVQREIQIALGLDKPIVYMRDM